MYSLLCSLSSFQSHYITWRTLCLNLLKIFLHKIFMPRLSWCCIKLLLVLKIRKLAHEMHRTAYKNFMRFRDICIECKAISAYIPTEAPWIFAVGDAVPRLRSSLEDWALRSISDMNWSFLSHVFSKAFRNAIWSTEKKKKGTYFPTV